MLAVFTGILVQHTKLLSSSLCSQMATGVKFTGETPHAVSKYFSSGIQIPRWQELDLPGFVPCGHCTCMPSGICVCVCGGFKFQLVSDALDLILRTQLPHCCSYLAQVRICCDYNLYVPALCL